MDLSARTPEGIHAKAVVLRALLENHTGISGRYENEDTSPSEEFACSLVNDLIGRAGA